MPYDDPSSDATLGVVKFNYTNKTNSPANQHLYIVSKLIRTVSSWSGMQEPEMQLATIHIKLF